MGTFRKYAWQNLCGNKIAPQTTTPHVPPPHLKTDRHFTPSQPLCLHKSSVNGCLTPNHKTDICVLTRRNVNTSPRTHVLKTKENDTCIRCIENTENRYMSSNLSKNSTKYPPTTCIEQTDMPDTCVLTNECAPGPPGAKQKTDTCVSPHGKNTSS